MAKIGLETVYKRLKTSKVHSENQVYIYLLRNAVIEISQQVWGADITYIPSVGRKLYLVAIMDCAARKALSWRLSITIDADLCIGALKQAIKKYGLPDIMNTDKEVNSLVNFRLPY